MTVVFSPSVLRGSVQAPPSKSVVHRLLLAAGLAAGESRVKNVSLSDDVSATLACLKSLGASWRIADRTVTVSGVGSLPPHTENVFPCGECGSTLRFFLPLCMAAEGDSVFTGSRRLLERPLTVYETICREQAIPFRNTGTAVTVGGRLKGGTFTVPGNISSQFVSGLLFTLPLLREDSTISLAGSVESRPYIDLTLEALRRFGVRAFWENKRTISVPGRQTYVPRDVTAEGDWSNAAFWFFLREMGADVEISGLRENSLQGDRICLALFDSIKNGDASPIDLSDCPDLAPVLMAAAAFYHGAHFTGTARLKIKESDRGSAMTEELLKCGVRTEVRENGITVYREALTKPSVPLSGHNDHRIVMALSCLLLRTGGKLLGAEAVKKSYPDFFSDLAACGAKLEISE